jgi:hypothetical protein
MQRFCLTASRFSLAAWLGAALFFVIVTLAPMSSPLLDSAQKAQLPLFFFPGYYAFEFTLLSIALAGGWAARNRPTVNRGLWRVQLAALTLALIVAVADRIWVYEPLAQILRQQIADHTAPPASFRNLHLASMYCNQVIIGLSLLAAILSHWPNRCGETRGAN